MEEAVEDLIRIVTGTSPRPARLRLDSLPWVIGEAQVCVGRCLPIELSGVLEIAAHATKSDKLQPDRRQPSIMPDVSR
jgi:hypothetical protein